VEWREKLVKRIPSAKSTELKIRYNDDDKLKNQGTVRKTVLAFVKG
jgi:hypothetical protein